MARKTQLLIMTAVVGLTFLVQFNPVAVVHATSDPGIHRQRYITSTGSYAYYSEYIEQYVKNTLPNEWIAGWTAEALRAGAVIIRSGAFWRVNRSQLGSSWPNNNCYQGGSGSTLYYRTVPQTRGGQEQWLPGSGQPSTDDAANMTCSYHAERVNAQSGRPDKLLPFRYNSTIQNSTNNAGGSWIDRIRYAYAGSSSYQQTECSQTDTVTYSDPIFVTF